MAKYGVKRLREFPRSVTATDPWQLLYLAGAVFLFLSRRMSSSFRTGSPFIGLLVKCQALALGPTGRKRHRMNPRLVGAAKAYNEGGG